MSRVAFVLLSFLGCVHDRPVSVSIATPASTSTIEAPVARVANGPDVKVATEGSYESWTSSWDGPPAISPDGRSVAYADQLVQERFPDGDPQRVSVGGLEWTYREPSLVVRDHGREVFAKTLGGGPASDDHCSYTARLRVASVDVKRRVLLVGLRYSAPPDWCPDDDVFLAFP
jgi:hypothetical protein